MLIIPTFIQSMDAPKTDFLYRGAPITPAVLMVAAKEQLALHPEQAEIIKKWADTNTDRLRKIIPFSDTEFNAFVHGTKPDDRELPPMEIQEIGFDTRAYCNGDRRNNLVFPLHCDDYKAPSPRLLVKSSGIINRLFTLLHAHKSELTGDPFDGARGADGLTYFVRSLRKFYPAGKGGRQTYQTSSTFATSLVLDELIEREKWDDIAIPKTFLGFIPGEPESVDDDHCFVVQEKIADAVPLHDHLLSGKKIQPKALKHALMCTKSAALWSILSRGNVLVKKDGSRLIFVDLEQPNNTDPADAFHMNAAKYHSDAACGLREWRKLIETCAAEPDRTEYLAEVDLAEKK